MGESTKKQVSYDTRLTALENAKNMTNEKDQIVASERDSQIFFDAITNPRKPSQALKKAVKDYKVFIPNTR